MKITIVTVGKVKEKFYRDAIAEYVKRLGRYCTLEILEVADEKTPDGAAPALEQQIIENLNVFATRHKLSQREREVLYLILLGKDNQNIASEMSLALSTVKVHVHNILKKTGDASRQELIQGFWKMS